MIIGIGNVGSTSLKTKIVDIDERDGIRVLGEANLDRIKTPGLSTFTHCAGNAPKEREEIDILGFKAGIASCLDWHIRNGVLRAASDIQAMGFKCVMGVTNGANHLTPKILDEMRRFVFVAPVHNTPYLVAIDAFRKILDVPMVGVFEPSLHHAIPEFRRYFGLPWAWHELGIRRLGFHGSSHRYLSAAAYRAAGTEDIRLLTVHLGGSSSLCAFRGGRSVDISTCFSPNSGVLQGTRAGDVDATAVLFAMKELGLTVHQAQDAISNDAGLKGLAGIGTDDLRAIEEAAAKGNARAAMAIDLFVDGVRKHIGACATVLGGLDMIVFGGGIGENADEIRARCLRDLEFMGIRLDAEKNAATRGRAGVISAARAKVEVRVVPTNEEVVVAYFTKKVVQLGRDLTPEEMVFRL